MDKKLHEALNVLLLRSRADEDDLLHWDSLPKELQEQLNLDEWTKIQDFVADAIVEKLEREEE